MRWFSIETAARVVGTTEMTIMLIARTGHIQRRGGSVCLPVGCWRPEWLALAMKMVNGGW